jgi:ATP-dependent Lon protease
MPGKGAIVLTGLLGEVMKESARIALSHLKSHQQDYGIPANSFDKWDIHIHFPAGAVPKDGPSAGITLTTALASLFTSKPVKHDIAMTGEVTLLGKVLPIGGLKEKILAAKRAGIHKLIVPAENEAGMADFDADILEGMDISYVDQVRDVLKAVLIGGLHAKPEPREPVKRNSGPRKTSKRMIEGGTGS